MKIVRLRSGRDDITYGGVEEEGIRLYRGTPFVAWEPTESLVTFEEAELLAPVLPTKIVAIGKNYADHAAEMDSVMPDEPLMFLKPATSVIGPHQPIVLPHQSTNVHHEVELAAVVGKVARNVSAENANDYLLGYTVANDVTARDLQASDGQWTRAKGFDTFCPLGPAIETEFDPGQGWAITCTVNDDLRQEGVLTDLHFGVGELLEHVTAVMTLLPGDVLLTGTPAGVGPIEAGDVVECSIEGIGTLRNPVGKR